MARGPRILRTVAVESSSLISALSGTGRCVRLSTQTMDTESACPRPGLRGDLCAPRWKLRGGRLAVEEKTEIHLRIGRSPDKGDACIYALAESAAMPIDARAFATGAISFERAQRER
jgi:hypothetical protein